MKKGLSVLLVAAALFGFYGGAVNLNDILNCKDYWEEAGEKSTADMNKLEDGLNQLKDNEQAYLDGLDQVAQGEKDLAAGEAQLAQGEADYAAAPGKLAAGRAALAEGEDALDSLDTLLGGIKQVHDGYQKLEAYEKLRDGRDGNLTNTDTSMSDMLTGVLQMLAQKDDYKAAASSALKELGTAKQIMVSTQQQAGNYSNEQYKGFYDAMSHNVAGLNTAYTLLSGVKDAFSGAKDGADSVVSTIKTASSLPADQAATAQAMINGANAGGKKLAEQNELICAAVMKLMDKSNTPGNYTVAASGALSTLGKTIGAGEGEVSAADYGKAAGTLSGLLGALLNGANGQAGLNTIVDTNLKGTLNDATAWKEGYELLTSSDTLNAKKNAVGGVAQIVDGVYGSGNKTLIKGFEKAAKSAGINLKNFQYASSSKLGKDLTSSSSIDDFHNDLKAIDKAFQKAKATANKLKKNGQKQLAAGRKQLAQGYADYAAAPGKLEDGRQQLADGRAQLAAGKDKLAQYEDGEQQVRDGLATLVGTEADLELESILDRLNGDGDFDNGDNHLELDEGLAAVDVGRGYQAEDGELITKEIMTRAIGTGGLLAAGVLAVLAAILSFLKKNKGAGVLAILSAVAGAFGAYEATQAGTYFSSIAGSTVGQTGMIAAGILAAVALVHSIAHFTAKKEA